MPASTRLEYPGNEVLGSVLSAASGGLRGVGAYGGWVLRQGQGMANDVRSCKHGRGKELQVFEGGCVGVVIVHNFDEGGGANRSFGRNLVTWFGRDGGKERSVTR